MIHFVIGTRAQLIKTAPIMAECKSRDIEYNFILLAQHKETMGEMIDMFGVKRPDMVIGDLNREISSVQAMAKWVMQVLAFTVKNRRSIFCRDRDGVVIVHGDALPAFIGAVMAKVAGLKVAHVEAGLRSFNFFEPFPEELIRVLTWELGLVDYYFCPNQQALRNLAKYSGHKVDTLRNTLCDSLNMALESTVGNTPDDSFQREPYAVVSLHRYETVSKKGRLELVVDILAEIAERVNLLFILHPITYKALIKHDLYSVLDRNPKISFHPRYDYFTFVKILRSSEFLVSDGGSNQEECCYLGHPCLLLRHRTERPDGIGRNAVLSKFDRKVIKDFIENNRLYRFPFNRDEYSASGMIVDNLDVFVQ